MPKMAYSAGPENAAVLAEISKKLSDLLIEVNVGRDIEELLQRMNTHLSKLSDLDLGLDEGRP